jgi:hypothetical protein
VIDRAPVASLPLLVPGKVGLGLSQIPQPLLPFGFEPSGDQAVLGIDGR